MKKWLLVFLLCTILGTSTTFANDTALDHEKWTEDYLHFENHYKDSTDQKSMLRTYQRQFQHSVQTKNDELHQLIYQYLEDPKQEKYAYYAVVYGLRVHMLEEALTRFKVEIPQMIQEGKIAESVQILDDTVTWISDIMDPTLQQWDDTQSSWTYTDLHAVLLPALRETILDGNKRLYDLFVPMIENVLHKVSMMDVITGVQEEIMQLKATTNKVDQEHEELTISPEQIRAMFAFYPLRNWMQEQDAEFAKEQAEILFDRLQNHPRFGIERVQERMTSALHAIVHNELQKLFFTDLERGDNHQALIRASDAVSATSLLEVAGVGWEQEDRFRFVQYHGEQFFLYMQQGQYQEARDAAFDMLKELVRFKGVFFRIGEPQLMMDGEAVQLGQMASFLDSNTQRTLVSARFLAESLGAAVEFDPSERTVDIIRNGQTIRLQIGSKDIFRNGQKIEQQLDQTVTLINERAYIPLRAAAELLGHQIFWHQGEIVIH